MERKYGIPRYTWFRQSALSGSPDGNIWDLLWTETDAVRFSTKSMPPDKYFRKVEVASMRGFYRARAEGHNTLVINPDTNPDQDLVAEASFTSFVSEKFRAKASLDLTHAYGKNATKVTRSFELKRGKYFTVTDRFHCKEPSEIWSFFHTEAEVTLSTDRRTAVMKQDGETLEVLHESPGDAVFKLLPAEPFPNSPNPPKQTSNQNRRKHAVHLTDAKETVITVRFKQPGIPPASEQGED